MGPAEIWPMIVGAAAVVFGSGQLYEKIRNNKYVSKEICAKTHEVDHIRWMNIKDSLDKMSTWIDEQRDHGTSHSS